MELSATIGIVVTQIEDYEISLNIHQTVTGRLLTINIYHLVMNGKQTTLNNFLQLSSDSEPDNISQYTPSPQKSVLKIPDQWT
jgi:hypothetical protein